MPYKIFISDSLSKEGLQIFEKEKDIELTVKVGLSPEELKKEIKGHDALVVRSATNVTSDIIDAADKLKVIGRAGVGVDNVDVDAASKKGIVVMNTPSGNTLSTCEQTISMILALSRNIPQAYISMKEKKWDRKSFMGVELNGKTLGIIGFGRIGREVAKRMIAFGMRVIAYDPFATLDVANMLSVKVVDNADDLFKEADYITVHTPLTEQTKYLINKDSFLKMKNGVRIINCARGGIVNEQDLCDAIKSGKVAGASLDVFESEPPLPDSPLYTTNNLIMTPHLGASTKEAQINVAIDVAKQIIDMLKHNEIKNAVNFPYIAPELFVKLKPYINLCEKIGQMIAQMEKGRYKTLDIQFRGDVCDFDTNPLTIATLKGLFSTMLEKSRINYVNAPLMAKERGMTVTSSKNKDLEDFAHLITVTVKTEDKKEISVAGTLFGLNDVRIVRINGFQVDAKPEGCMLLCENQDRPGFVGKIGTLLGTYHVNIANMSLGRKEKGKTALVIFNVDDIISSEILEKIKSLDLIEDAKVFVFN